MKKSSAFGGLALFVSALVVGIYAYYRIVPNHSTDPQSVAMTVARPKRIAPTTGRQPRHAVRQAPRQSAPAELTVAHPGPIISWHNAPSPDPGVLDGVYMIYNPLRPSGGPYPVLAKGEQVWIDVSISQQLLYIFHGSTRIYTMATSSGMQAVKGDGSPPGIYHVQAERGKWFYLPKEHVGAKYWVSWSGNGVYLFHSVPMTRNKQIMPYVAADLLHEASFGCFLLTVADAKWIYDNVPYGTTVIVERPPLLLQGNKIFDPTNTQTLAAFLTDGSPAGVS